MQASAQSLFLSFRLSQPAAAPENRWLLRAGEPSEEPEPLEVKVRRKPPLFLGPNPGPSLQRHRTSK